MIIVFFYPRCHACSLSLERSLVDNLLFKMQTPICHWQRNDVKRGDGKMCLQVLRWQYKINFKIPKCLSIDKSLPRVNSLKCASKTRRLLQILHSLRIFFSHCASVHFCWDAVFRIWFDSGNSKLLQTCFTWNLKEFQQAEALAGNSIHNLRMVKISFWRKRKQEQCAMDEKPAEWQMISSDAQM